MFLSAGLPLKFSGVAAVAAPSFLRLDKGDLGTVVGSPTKNLDGLVGPSYVASLSGTSNGTSVKFTTGTVSTLEAVTFAAIIRPTAAAGNMAIACTATAGSQIQFFLSSGTFNLYNGSYLGTGLSATAGNAYFVVLSTAYQSSPAIQLQNLTLLNLATGVIKTWTGTYGFGLTDYATVYLGSDWVPGNSLTGGIAAVAITRSFLSLQEQALWAADPWSFWYPASTPIVAAISLGAGSAPGQASVLGRGSCGRHRRRRGGRRGFGLGRCRRARQRHRFGARASFGLGFRR